MTSPPTRLAKTAKRGGCSARSCKHWADYVYVLPAIGVMVLVIGYPIVYTVWLSFQRPNAGRASRSGTASAATGVCSMTISSGSHDEHSDLDDRFDLWGRSCWVSPRRLC